MKSNLKNFLNNASYERKKEKKKMRKNISDEIFFKNSRTKLSKFKNHIFLYTTLKHPPFLLLLPVYRAFSERILNKAFKLLTRLL